MFDAVKMLANVIQQTMVGAATVLVANTWPLDIDMNKILFISEVLVLLFDKSNCFLKLCNVCRL